MKSFRFASTLLGAACALLLAGCRSAPEPPRVTVSADSFTPVSEKTKLFVVEYFSATFGDNGRLFQERFATLAQSCQVTIEFFRMPVSDKLTLDPAAETAAAQGELSQRLGIFQPDGILEAETAGWHAPGSLASSSTTPPPYATFDIKLRLKDSKRRADQWRASGALAVKAGTGGELLADKTVRLLTATGALPHCPK